MTSEPEFDINELYQAAQFRWLKAPEVLFILRNHEKCQFTETLPQQPPSGSLLLFNKRVLKFFRNDGHIWQKKKAGRTTREGHEKLKVRKVEALSCYYAQGEENPTFRRRSYWMLDPEYEHIVLVHYREVIEGRRRHKAGSTPCLAGGISSMLNTRHFPQNQCSTSAISESCGTYHNTLDPGSMEVSSQLLDTNNFMSHFEEWATFTGLDNLSKSEGRYNSQPTFSSISSPRYFSAPNQCSTSAVNQSYGTYHKSLDPGFIEVNSQVFNKNNELDQLEGRDIVGEFNSTEPEISEALRRLGEELSFGDKVEIFPQCRPNENSTDYVIADYEKRPNQDELAAGLEYKKLDHFSCGNASILDDSNNSQLLLNTDEYAFERKESPRRKELQVEDYPVSTLIGFQSNNFNTLERSVADPINENEQSSSERGGNSGDLTKQQGKWTPPWLDNSGSNTGIWDSYSPMFEDDSATQFLSNSDNTMASLNSASALQQVVNSTSLANFSGANTQETNPNYYTMWYDQENQLENHRANSRLTVAHEQRFSIQEISPEWAYAEDHTKIIITGSFNCDPSNYEWTCMFGDVEVPIQIIQEGVLCCQAPSHIPGKVTLCITTGNRESCSEVREFEYRAAPRSSDHSSLQPTDATKSTEELQLLIQFVHMLMCQYDTFIQKEYTANSGACVLGKSNIDADTCAHMIKALLVGSENQSSIMDWLLQELLKDKLQHWLLSKCEKGETAGCALSKKEQEVLHMVAGLGFEWALNPILSCGIGINFRDINGWTALHHAAHFGREKMVGALIAAGASAGAVTDPTQQNPAGKTAGSIAAARGHKGLAGYISERELTSHLSSLTLEESELSIGPAAVEAELTVESISNGSLGCTKDQISLKDSLDAVRNAKLAATRIQAAFRAHSFKKRKQREAHANNICDEYGITVNDIPGLSAMSKLMFHDLDNCKLENAALSIQKRYRGHKERQNYWAVRQKVVRIQAHVRGYQVRKKYKVILWAVGVLEKVLLRWRRKGSGLRGFRTEMESAGASDDEDIMKVFRKEKVHARIEQAVSWVISMVQTPDSRKQYRRLLESYRQAKAEAKLSSSSKASETASSSQSFGENMEINLDDMFPSPPYEYTFGLP